MSVEDSGSESEQFAEEAGSDEGEEAEYFAAEGGIEADALEDASDSEEAGHHR
jgi:hypothetical protein